MTLESLRALQKRVRDCTKADRELDLAICKALGRAPDDAIWEVTKWNRQAARELAKQKEIP